MHFVEVVVQVCEQNSRDRLDNVYCGKEDIQRISVLKKHELISALTDERNEIS